jgi:hypothetical protein
MKAKTCARCGKRLRPNGLRVYSHFTRSYYCANVPACAKRARHRIREEDVA